jgi:hypothetical protein
MIAEKPCRRFGDVVTCCEFSIAVHGDADRECGCVPTRPTPCAAVLVRLPEWRP